MAKKVPTDRRLFIFIFIADCSHAIKSYFLFLDFFDYGNYFNFEAPIGQIGFLVAIPCELCT